MSKTYSKTRILVECALMIAIGTVLSNIKFFTMPNGGSITLLSMLPFVLVSFRHGVKWGLFTAELFAVVHYLHRLSTEGKRGAKMALESCPKCHFIMLEGVLMTIEEHGQNGTIYVSDLAAAVKQPLPAVSRALRQLEQDGLIERITDPNDRRKTLVRPTEKGLDASRQVETAISRYFERVICRIPRFGVGSGKDDHCQSGWCHPSEKSGVRRCKI